jgi:hypothetical protein
VLALGGLFYLVYRDWVDEQRDNLIQEVLWLEQSMRLHMEGQQEWAEGVAADIASGRSNPALHFQCRVFHARKPGSAAGAADRRRTPCCCATSTARLPRAVLHGDEYDAVWRAMPAPRILWPALPQAGWQIPL